MTLLEYINQQDRYARSSGMQLTEVREGYAIAEMTVEERHLNAGNVCQGGALFTLADLANAAVMNSHGLLTLGLENQVTYHNSARQGDHLRAIAKEVCDHRKIPYVRVEVLNQQDTLIASFTALAYRKETPFKFDALM